MKAPGSTNVAQSMGACGHHHIKGKSAAVDGILPNGVQIDCTECLQNFTKQANILFTIFQLTFEEQDAERAARPTSTVNTVQELEITRDRDELQDDLPTKPPVRESIPPIVYASSLKSHSNAKKKGKSVRDRPRTNGRFMPGPRLAFEAPVNPESTITEVCVYFSS